MPGESHGWRSLVGYSPWGRKESDTTERLHLQSSPKRFIYTQVLKNVKLCIFPLQRNIPNYLNKKLLTKYWLGNIKKKKQQKKTRTLNLPLQSKGNILTGNRNLTPFPKKLVLQRELVFSNVFILYDLCSSKLKCLYKKTNSKWRLLRKKMQEKIFVTLH